MPIAKVSYNGQTLLDASENTVTANKLVHPETALNALGETITGTINIKHDSDVQFDTSNGVFTAPAGVYESEIEYDLLGDNGSMVLVDSSGNVSTAGSITTQGTTTITPSTSAQTIPENTFLTGNVTVAAIPNQYIIPSGSLDIETNSDNIDVASYATVNVNVPQGSLNPESIIVTPTEEQQNITPSSGHDSIQSVQVNAIPSTYVGTGIPERYGTDLSVSGLTVTTPSGYYATTESKSVDSGSVTIPNKSITAVPTITIDNSGLINASVSASDTVTPTVTEGYVTNVSSSSINVSGSNTEQLTTVGATTIIPADTTQTAVSAGTYTLGDVVVDAIPSSYIIPTGTVTIDRNVANYDIAQYAKVNVEVDGSSIVVWQTKDVTPTESAQTITADASQGYDGLSSVQVAAIPNDYVGSSITHRDDNDITAAANVVTVPSGYYEDTETATVSTGSAGTPTATKGTISNNSISVTPSVTNTTGYISGGTITGTPVTVSASELTSGTWTPSGAGTADITNYATASIPAAVTHVNTASFTINPTISVDSEGVITTSVARTLESAMVVSTPGYISQPGTRGLLTITGSKTQELDTQGATTITPTTTAQTAVAAGKFTTGTITVNPIPSEYIVPSGKLTVLLNETDIDVSSYASLDVQVPTGTSSVTLQEKTGINPSESSQTITPDSGYDAISRVQINGISSSYIGTAVTRNDSSDLTSSMLAAETHFQGTDIQVKTAAYAGGHQISLKGTSLTGCIIPGDKLTISGVTYTVSTGRVYQAIDNSIEGITVSPPLADAIAEDTAVTVALTEPYVIAPAGYYDTDAKLEVKAIGHANPTISFDNASGAITVQHTQQAGYVAAADTKVVNTYAPNLKAASIFYPSLSDQVISAGRYLTGDQTIKGVVLSNLSAENIKYGTTIRVGDGSNFNRITSVTGAYTIDANATAAQILNGATAYVKGTKLTGTMTNRAAMNYTLDATSNKQSFTIPEGYHNGSGKVNIVLESKTVTPIPRNAQTITPTSGKVLAWVTVNPIPSNYIVPTGTKSITTNGTGIDVSNYASVDVNVEGSSSSITLQSKTNITPTEESQTVTYDSGYDGLSSVQINAIASDYVGTGVPRQVAQIITPTTSNQTIASDQYLTGAQTVEGIVLTNLTADNIVSGVTVKIGTATDDDSVATITGTAEAQASISPTSMEVVNGTLRLIA